MIKDAKAEQARGEFRACLPLPPFHAPRDFYVYIIKAGGFPFYVGKGTGFRAWRHFNAAALLFRDSLMGRTSEYAKPLYVELAGAVVRGVPFTVEISAEALSEQAAFSLEKKIVKEHGRLVCKSGKLRNLAKGGPSVGSGYFDAKRKHQEGVATARAGGRGRPGKSVRRFADLTFGAFGSKNLI